jgi:hypothetical protein
MNPLTAAALTEPCRHGPIPDDLPMRPDERGQRR